MEKHIAHLYGLIGYPLSHSFSKRYFTEKFEREGLSDRRYELFPLPAIDKLPELIKRFPELRGLNVTIPYKEVVLPLLDEVQGEAAAIGAVNTIAVRKEALIGYNTDVYGFETSLRRFLEENGARPGAALMLGTGGAAKAVAYVLGNLSIPFLRVSRNPERGDLIYEEIDQGLMDRHQLIINTTPLGMAPGIETFPILPYEYLTSGHLLYDLVYNPERTAFLRKGARRGCPVKNGLEMLYLQAERSWAIWNSA